MRSVKPGRGPSMMGGISALIVGVVGVGWTIGASQMGAPDLFTLFGVGFVVLAVCMAVYNFHNATARRRFSAFDVTEDGEEPDPLNRRFGEERPADETPAPAGEARFCIQCGAELPENAQFCPRCGKRRAP